MRTFDDYKNDVSSEKLVLAVLHASKRLMAWTLHSGSIYKLENFDVQSIVSIEDSGTEYVATDSLAGVTAAKFYNDRENKVLYLRTTGSDNPNGRFLVLTFKLFFSNAPVVLPDDLSIGPEVYWEPLIKSTSSFGVEIDTINQTSEAIEGSGTLTLHNDGDFWPRYFDKLTFENKPCFIYSHNRDLESTEAKLLFKGFVEKKAYKTDQIQFSLKDLLSEFKAAIPLDNIEDLGLRTSSDLAMAKQRMIFGRVFGHRPVNLDEVLDGYPLTGTVSISAGTNALSGTGTAFLTELSPDDTLTLGGVDYTIATVTSNTVATLSENLDSLVGLTNVAATLKPDQPKRFMNRTWLVAGHPIRQPTTVTEAGSTITRLTLGSTKDIYSGDMIWVGELVQVDQVISSKVLTLTTSLAAPPVIGTTVFKPGVQNVRIDDVLLRYDDDYSFDPETAVLTLSVDAEKNAAPLKQMASNLVFNSTSTVTGTSLKSFVKPGSLVGCVGNAEMFEVLSVESDTSLTLRTPATFTDTDKGLYKTFILDPDSSVLTCDAFGRTEDGTSTGALIDSAPKAVRALLEDVGLSDSIDEASFTEAEETAYQPIGLVIPEGYSDTDAPTYRDVFNRINRSVFGSVVQTQAFLISYKVLQPSKDVNALRLDEADILNISTTSAADKLVKTSIVRYRPLEYDYTVKKESVSTAQKTSDVATYLIKTDRTRTFETILVNEADALRQAKRWAMILENSATAIKLTTKLQGVDLEVGSIVDISHAKLYERFQSSTKRKLAMVESVKKSGNAVEIVLVDLSNTFNRVAAITDVTTGWSDTNEEGRLYGGFITDQYGLIDNDAESFGSNIIF